MAVPRFCDGRVVTGRVAISNRAHRQQQSQLFRLPLEIRLLIYEAAAPDIGDWQHVFSNHATERKRWWRFWRHPCYACDGRPLACDGDAHDDPEWWLQPGARRRREPFLDYAAHLRCASEGLSPADGMSKWRPWRDAKRGSPRSLLLSCRRVYHELMPLCNRALVFDRVDTLHYFLSLVSDEVLSYITDLSINLDFSFPASFHEDEPWRWREACAKLAQLPELRRVRVNLEHGMDGDGRLRHRFDEVMIQPLSQLAAKIKQMEIDRLRQAYFSHYGIRGMDQQEWRVLRPAKVVPEDQCVSCDEPFKGLKTIRLLKGSDVPCR